MSARTKARVAQLHRWVGLALSLPLLGWVVSSMALIVITFDMPNGLQGIYRLQPYNSVDIPLGNATLQPAALLNRLSSDYGIERVHWLRLESRGAHLWYVVRPTPSSLAMTFDARSGERLDPLPDDLLRTVANESLEGSRAVALRDTMEFNRDYGVDRVPAVEVTMSGQQPSTLVLSRDSGRTLKRMDADARSFHWWYRMFHVNQYTDHVIPWTALLYSCVAGVLFLVVCGYMMFWWRRRPVSVSTGFSDNLSARNIHRKLGVVVGAVLIIQLLAGVYIWLSLGPLNHAFRGKPSINSKWNAGITTRHPVADVPVVLERVSKQLPASSHPVQSVEWRRLGETNAWLIKMRNDELPLVFDADNARRIDVLAPWEAGNIARQETTGNPDYDYLGPLLFESMDLNTRLPAYRFRFKDEGLTDVYVLQNTGEIIMRRPEFWRIFGPFLSTHMLAVTRNKGFDVSLLALFQISFIIVIVTGWKLHFSMRQKRAETSGAPIHSVMRNAAPEPDAGKERA